MSIQFHNTLRQRLEPFEPIHPGEARIYACGLTPYAPAHAGHGRAAVAFDVLVRFLRSQGVRVRFVRNVTDVDDKILQRARELGEEPLAFSARMAQENLGDLVALGCLEPDEEPRVSAHIPEILALIETLIAKEAAYVVPTATGQDVYFAVRRFAAYGKLSSRNLEDLRVGARLAPGDRKRDPLDFALWKGCSASEWGWPSPWGQGRPGWHIECSAMAGRYLGEQFDIHCGGMDLIFPHHENEIAQSEAAWGGPFARYWLHNGFVTVEEEKMSKSLGNWVSLGDLFQRNDPEAVRYFFLGTHYRGPLGLLRTLDVRGNVCFPGIEEAERRVEYLHTTRADLHTFAEDIPPSLDVAPPLHADCVRRAPLQVYEALGRDLHTPHALAVLAELAKSANEFLAQAKRSPRAERQALQAVAAATAQALAQCVEPLGLLQTTGEEFLRRTQAQRLERKGLSVAWIEQKLQARAQARAEKQFAASDALRAELAEGGITLFDDGPLTRWRVGLS